MTLGEKIRAFRIRAGLKQEELAQKIGVGKRIISFYETNKITPSTDVVRRLSDVFGVTADFLIHEKETGDGIIRDRELMKYMLMVDRMPSEDQQYVKRFLRSMIVDARLKDVTSEPGDTERVPALASENVLSLPKRIRVRKALKQASG